MKIDNSFALAVSIAIAASLTATMTQVRAESDPVGKLATDSTQMKKVNINNSLMNKAPSRAKLQTMSAKDTLALDAAGKIKLTVVERNSLKDKINIDKVGQTVMCPW